MEYLGFEGKTTAISSLPHLVQSAERVPSRSSSSFSSLPPSCLETYHLRAGEV